MYRDTGLLSKKLGASALRAMSSASLVSPRNLRPGSTPYMSGPEANASPRSLNVVRREATPRGASPLMRGGSNGNRFGRPPLNPAKSSKSGQGHNQTSPRDRTEESDLKSPKGGPSPQEDDTGPGSVARIAVPEVQSLEHAHATIKMLAAQADEARAEKAAIWEQARDDARAMAQVAKNIEGNQGGRSPVLCKKHLSRNC